MELSNKISAATLARTAVLLLALTNQVLSAMGKPVLPIESTTVEQLVTAGITTVAALKFRPSKSGFPQQSAHSAPVPQPHHFTSATVSLFSATNSCDLCKISNSGFGIFSQIMRFYIFFLDNLH